MQKTKLWFYPNFKSFSTLFCQDISAVRRRRRRRQGEGRGNVCIGKYPIWEIPIVLYGPENAREKNPCIVIYNIGLGCPFHRLYPCSYLKAFPPLLFSLSLSNTSFSCVKSPFHLILTYPRSYQSLSLSNIFCTECHCTVK